MARSGEQRTEMIFVPPEYWDLLQETLMRAIGGCNDIASSVEAHQRLGLHDAERLLDQINGQVREVRKLLELIEVPF
jgi:hypothetical protein